jgi:hypothetical protein
VILGYGREMKSRFGNQILTGDMNIDTIDWEFGSSPHVKTNTWARKKDAKMEDLTKQLDICTGNFRHISI